MYTWLGTSANGDPSPNSATCMPSCTSSTRRMLRSRQSARFVSGSSKNAGTGNCCTCAP